MSIKNALRLYQNRYYTRIEICCNEQQYDDTISFIMRTISNTAKRGNLFIEYYGNNLDLEDSDYVIEEKKDTKDTFKKTLWIRETWLNITNKSFVEERYAILYVFDRAFSWETFLQCANSGLNDILRIQALHFLATFGECQFPCLYIKHGDIAKISIVDYFRSKGFVVKHRIN